MGGKGNMIVRLREFKKRLGREFPVQKVILFGSRARGAARRGSDADVIVVSSKFSRLDFMQRAARMYDYWAPGMPVDFICYTPAEFQKRAKGITIVREALREGIVV